MNISNWANLSSFLQMGGYGLYVWGSFGMAAAVMAAECLALRGRRQAIRTASDPTAPAADFGTVAHEA